MNIDIKPLRHGMIEPLVATFGSAGADVHACLDAPVHVHPGQTVLIPLGFAMRMVRPGALANGMLPAAFLLPRSGLGHKHGIVLGNLVGLIDEDYRDEVCVSVWNRNTDGQAFEIKHGDRIAQMVVVPVFLTSFHVVGALDTTCRTGGFGSTGV